MLLAKSTYLLAKFIQQGGNYKYKLHHVQLSYPQPLSAKKYFNYHIVKILIAENAPEFSAIISRRNMHVTAYYIYN